MGKAYWCWSQPSPHFSYSEINALPLNGQQAVTAISALWLRRSTAFRWLQQPIGRHLMIDVVEQVIERHQEVKNEGISEGAGTDSGTSDGGQLGGGPGGNPGGARDDPDRGAEPVQYGFLAIPQHVRRSGRCRQAGRGRHRRAADLAGPPFQVPESREVCREQGAEQRRVRRRRGRDGG